MNQPGPLALIRLLQLTSPTLPVGAYTYSQGLEWAVESGRIANEGDAGRWIGDLLAAAIGRLEAPLLSSLMRHWAQDDIEQIRRLDREFLASRESAELRAETLQMGFSLKRLLAELNDPLLATIRKRLQDWPEVAFPTVWSGIAAAWKIEPLAAVSGYLWSWAENQVMAALKAVPFGQAAGQRLLAELGQKIPDVAAKALQLPENQWSNFTPAFSICSARHETQYSRLFRS
ncbi:MAG: urease accessory protein UreF [Betaproteobacteria bacterium]